MNAAESLEDNGAAIATQSLRDLVSSTMAKCLVCPQAQIIQFCHPSAIAWGMEQCGLVPDIRKDNAHSNHDTALSIGFVTAEDLSPSKSVAPCCSVRESDSAADHEQRIRMTQALSRRDREQEPEVTMSTAAAKTLLPITEGPQGAPVLVPRIFLREVHVLLYDPQATFVVHAARSFATLFMEPLSASISVSLSKVAFRRAQAANELVASEATYVSRMLRLVGAFVQPLAPGPLELPPVPPSLLGSGKFDISNAVMELLDVAPQNAEMHSDEADAASTGGSSAMAAHKSSELRADVHAGRASPGPARVRQLVRYSSSGSRTGYASSERGTRARRFSWLGGPKDPSSLISGHIHAMLFREVHSLLSANFDVLQGLREALAAATGDAAHALDEHSALKFEVGDLMLAFSSDLLRYSTYVSNYSTAATQLRELKSSDSAFGRWLQAVESDPSKGQGHTLESFLILPVQRVPRYSMLLSALLKYTPEGHPEHAKLRQAVDAVESAAATINEAIASQHPILALEAVLTPRPAPSIVSRKQQIIRSGWLSKTVSESIRSSKEYLFVQLADRLLYASVEKHHDELMSHRQQYVQQVQSLPAVQVATVSSERVNILDAPEMSLPPLPLTLKNAKLHLHNSLQIHRLFAPMSVEGRILLQLEASPKPITLVFRSWPEAMAWHESLKSIVGSPFLPPIASQQPLSHVNRLRKQSSAASSAAGSQMENCMSSSEGKLLHTDADANSNVNQASGLASSPPAQHEREGAPVPANLLGPPATVAADVSIHPAGSTTALRMKGESVIPVNTDVSLNDSVNQIEAFIGPGTPILRIGGVNVAPSSQASESLDVPERDSGLDEPSMSVLQVQHYLARQASSRQPILLTVAVL